MGSTREHVVLDEANRRQQKDPEEAQAHGGPDHTGKDSNHVHDSQMLATCLVNRFAGLPNTKRWVYTTIYDDSHCTSDVAPS